MKNRKIPADFPVRPLGPNDPAEDRATCGTCGRSWDDAIATEYTPAPSARCPFEAYHDEPREPKRKAHKPGPAVKVQFFDADGYVIAEATGTAVAKYRAAPDLLAVLDDDLAMLIELRDKHLSHTAAVVRALVQKRIEATQAALAQARR